MTFYIVKVTTLNRFVNLEKLAKNSFFHQLKEETERKKPDIFLHIQMNYMHAPVLFMPLKATEEQCGSLLSTGGL